MTQAPGRLHSVASGNVLVGAEEVFDDDLELRQSELNELVYGSGPTSMKSRLESIDAAFQVNGEDAVITTDPQEVVTGGGKVPTTNAVAGAITAKMAHQIPQSETRVAILPGHLNVWVQPMRRLEIVLGGAQAGMENEWKLQFSCPSNAGTELVIEPEVQWANDDEIEPEPGYTYQISIENGLAVYASWETSL